MEGMCFSQNGARCLILEFNRNKHEGKYMNIVSFTTAKGVIYMGYNIKRSNFMFSDYVEIPSKGKLFMNPHTDDQFELYETSRNVIEETAECYDEYTPEHLHLIEKYLEPEQKKKRKVRHTTVIIF